MTQISLNCIIIAQLEKIEFCFTRYLKLRVGFNFIIKTSLWNSFFSFYLGGPILTLNGIKMRIINLHVCINTSTNSCEYSVSLRQFLKHVFNVVNPFFFSLLIFLNEIFIKCSSKFAFLEHFLQQCFPFNYRIFTTIALLVNPFSLNNCEETFKLISFEQFICEKN